MSCFFHKWNGCKCEKCGKTRSVRKMSDHDFYYCKCLKCGFIRDEGHSYKCGKCTICGAVDASKGHGDRRNWDYRMNGGDVEFFCKDCGRVMKTEDYSRVYYAAEQELRNAEDAGCESPYAECLLYWLKKSKPY
jgi:hypothetical protein